MLLSPWRFNGQIRQVRAKAGEVGDASPKEGHAEEQLRPQSDKPEAGDRHRSERGQTEGREGPLAQQSAKETEQQTLVISHIKWFVNNSEGRFLASVRPAALHSARPSVRKR